MVFETVFSECQRAAHLADDRNNYLPNNSSSVGYFLDVFILSAFGEVNNLFNVLFSFNFFADLRP